MKIQHKFIPIKQKNENQTSESRLIYHCPSFDNIKYLMTSREKEKRKRSTVCSTLN